MTSLTIALDVMGGDHGPHITLPAAIRTLHLYPNLHLKLCGIKEQILPYLHDLALPLLDRIEILHCPQVVTMDEKPSNALRHKKSSSLRKAIDLVESGDAQACISAGNTGALMAIAQHVLKRIPGVHRPALVSTMPTRDKNKVWLLDLGANMNCDANILFQYAVMGSVLAQEVDDVEHPKVGLLNVGEEQIKGNAVVKEAATKLSNEKGINYIGFVEGTDIFTNTADVVVTDGFVGNVALKSIEGIAQLIIHQLKRVSTQNLFYRLLAKIALPILRRLYSSVNPDQYNGASLIGLRGIVVKSHGNASIDAFVYAIEEAQRQVSQQVPNKIKDKIASVLTEHA